MKNIKSYLLSFILGGIIFSGITVFAEYVITADKIEYSANTSVKDKIDDLYSAKNTIIFNKNQQIANLTAERDNLQSQLNSITPDKSSFSFVSTTTPKTFDLGFKPKYISCFALLSSSNSYNAIIYNQDYSSNYVYKWDAITQQTTDAIQRDLSVFYTINNNGFTWNITNWNGERLYCTAAK